MRGVPEEWARVGEQREKGDILKVGDINKAVSEVGTQNIYSEYEEIIILVKQR